MSPGVAGSRWRARSPRSPRPPDLPIAFHDCSGPVTLAASTHLALACPNVREQEIARAFYYGWYGELVDRPPPLEAGTITVPEGPGLGLALAGGLTARGDARIRVSRA